MRLQETPEIWLPNFLSVVQDVDIGFGLPELNQDYSEKLLAGTNDSSCQVSGLDRALCLKKSDLSTREYAIEEVDGLTMSQVEN